MKFSWIWNKNKHKSSTRKIGILFQSFFLKRNTWIEDGEQNLLHGHIRVYGYSPIKNLLSRKCGEKRKEKKNNKNDNERNNIRL